MSHVQLLVSDVEASARWYTAVLSLVPFAQDFETGYVALRQPEARLVVVLTKSSGHTQGPAAPKDDSLDHLAFAVSDRDALQAWAEHLAALGIEHDGVVLEEGRPTLQLRDPDGIAIELVTS
jgi:catechol-2,3-dioxygenase